MVAGNVRCWSECLTDLFEHDSAELEFVQALAEELFKEIDVRCPAYAEILSKLVDVGELVDFGASVGRRGQGDFKCLIDRKKTLAQGDEWLPVGCDSRRDRQMGYQDVYLACNNTSIFRDARWFSNFEWRCKMFAWRECPWITATPVALLDLTTHYLIFHCEWIGEKGVMRSDGCETTVTDETWVGVWRVVEWMLLVIWSGNMYKDKPVWVCAGALCEGLDKAETQMRQYEWTSTDGRGKPSWRVCAAHIDPTCRSIHTYDTGKSHDARGEFGVEGAPRAAETCQAERLRLSTAANLYWNTVVQALLNFEEDHGHYWEDGQEPGRWTVGQTVYSARRGFTATLESEPVDDRVKLIDRTDHEENPTQRMKPTSRQAAELVVAPLKRTSAVQTPRAGGSGVIIRGRRRDLIGRRVTVDAVFKSKCDVHYFEGGVRKELRQLELTSVHGLDDAGADPEWEFRAELPTEEQQKMLETRNVKVMAEIIREFFLSDVPGCDVVVRRTPQAGQKEEPPRLGSTKQSEFAPDTECNEE